MTTPAAMTTPPSPARRRGGALVAAAAVALAAGLLLAGPAGGQVGGPVGPTTTDDEPTTTSTEPRQTTAPETTSTTAAPTTTRAATDDEVSEADDDDDSGVSPAVAVGGALVLGLAALVVGLLVGVALGRRRSTPATGAAPYAPPAGPTPAPAAVPSAPPATKTPSPTPAPAAAGPIIGPAPDRDTDRLRNQRDGLVAGMIDLRDQLPSAVLRDEVGRTLAAAGVSELQPDGQPFDPAVHRAVAQRPATDVALHNTVAATERPGYLDGARVLRQPEVVVHRVDGQP